MIFNKPYINTKALFLALLIGSFCSCEEEINLVFSEINILEEKEAVVEINIPNAEGQDIVSANINSELLSFTTNALNIESDSNSEETFEKGIEQFNSSFISFKNNINSELQTELAPWEATIDGEVTYQSNNVICIAMNTYLNTGAIHGTSKISFLNFDASTGQLFDYKEFINDQTDFKRKVKSYFEKEAGFISDEDFKLPESIGLNDEGVIILYNINEIPSFTDKLIEFNIPFDEVKSYLKRY